MSNNFAKAWPGGELLRDCIPILNPRQKRHLHMPLACEPQRSGQLFVAEQNARFLAVVGSCGQLLALVPIYVCGDQ